MLMNNYYSSTPLSHSLQQRYIISRLMVDILLITISTQASASPYFLCLLLQNSEKVYASYSMFHLFDWTQFKRFCRGCWHSFICYLGLWQERYCCFRSILCSSHLLPSPDHKMLRWSYEGDIKKHFSSQSTNCDNFWMKLCRHSITKLPTISFWCNLTGGSVSGTPRSLKKREKINDKWTHDTSTKSRLSEPDGAPQSVRGHNTSSTSIRAMATDFKMNISNFILVYKSLTVHREMWEDKTPLQSAFQNSRKQCKLSYGMVSFLVII